MGRTMPHRSTDARCSVTEGNPVVVATVQTGLAGGQPVSSMADCGHDKEAGIPPAPRRSQSSEASRAHHPAAGAPS
jgi:hypothetical protein